VDWRPQVTADVPSFGEYALGPWISAVTPLISASAAQAYRLHAERWSRAIGGSPLDSVGYSTVQAAVGKLAQKYSPAQVRIGATQARRILCDAARDGLCGLPTWSLRDLRLPRGLGPPEGNRLSPDEVRRVLGALAAQGPPWLALATVSLLTGARWGTVTALRWGDVDHAAGVLHLRRSQWHGVEKPGDKTGKRTQLPLTEGLAAVLKRPEGARDGDLVFPAPRAGGFMRPNSMAKPLRRALAEAGIERRVTPHGFRRAWIDEARKHGGLLPVGSIAGHSSIAMTNHYSLVDLGEKRQVMEGVESSFLAAAGPSGKAASDLVPDVNVKKARVVPKAAKARK
jgi:integrase